MNMDEWKYDTNIPICVCMCLHVFAIGGGRWGPGSVLR